MRRVVIIAEAGVNHNGSLETAKQLIDVASQAGVDYVKFQSFVTENLVSKSAQKAEYQSKNMGQTGEDNSQYTMLKALELSAADHQELIAYCYQVGVQFLSTAFDFESIELLHKLGITLWKIPSGEITNYPYLKRIAQLGEPIILSTGMATLDEVTTAMEVLLAHGAKREQITLLHCTTEYPAPIHEVNLRAMQTLRDHFGVAVGYSDHTEGITIPIAATAMGATVIEKHFTLDREMEGPDHKASLEPHELATMCRAIREVEAAQGSGIKAPSPAELKNIAIARKSIVAKCAIAKGELLTTANITTKRPALGLSPMAWERIIGSPATRSYQVDECIEGGQTDE